MVKFFVYLQVNRRRLGDARRYVAFDMSNRPQFLESSTAVIDTYGNSLGGIIGDKLTDAWVAWDLEHNEWFNDEPVVFNFGDRQLEACFNQLSQFAITWDTVDVNQPPNWMDCFDGMPLQWRRNGHETLANAIGETLESIAVVDRMFRTTVLDNKNHPKQIRESSEFWMLYALEFEFNTCTVVLYNALDENGLQGEPLSGGEVSKQRIVAT